MEELTKGVTKLAVRNTNLPRTAKRNGPEKDEEKKPGILTSIRRLFTSESKAEDDNQQGENTWTADGQKPAPRFFVQHPDLPLPIADDCVEFDLDMCNYIYRHQFTISASFLTSSSITPTQRNRIIAHIAGQCPRSCRQRELGHPIEVFHLAARLVDALIEAGTITAQSAELFCVAAIIIAAKYERQARLSRHILGRFATSEWKSAERQVLRAVKFNLGRSTVIHCLRIIAAGVLHHMSPADHYENQERHVQAWNAAKVLTQLAVCDHHMVAGVPPSLAASAVLRLTLAMIGTKWTPAMTMQSQHSIEDIDEKTKLLYKFVVSAVKENHPVLTAIEINAGAARFIEHRIEYAGQFV